MENFELYLQYHKEITENKLKTINRFMKQTKPKPVKRTSRIGIVENILKVTGRPGAPKKYGAKLKLLELFEQRADSFQKATVDIYGNNKTIHYFCRDLLWKPIKEKLRFILDGSETFILMCSDLTLSLENIITAYSYHFKIEVNFKVIKHVIGAFFCHFWTSLGRILAIKTNLILLFRQQPSREEINHRNNECHRGLCSFRLHSYRYLANIILEFS